MMKRGSVLLFTSEVFGFTVFALAMYVVLLLCAGLLPSSLRPNLILNEFPVGFSSKRFQEAESENKVDIVVLGPSRAYRGYDPRNFENNGISLFNLGSTAQTPIQSEVLASRFLDKLSPELVLLDVSSHSFSSDGIESTIDLFSSTPIDKYGIRLLRDQPNLIVFNAITYYGVRQLLGLKSNSKNWIETDRYIENGFVEKALVPYSNTIEKLPTGSWNENQLQGFRRLIKNIKSSGADVLLIHSPLPKVPSDKIEFDSLMKSYGTYLDYSNLEGITDSLDYYDLLHLNQSGVNKFNTALVQDLISRGHLK